MSNTIKLSKQRVVEDDDDYITPVPTAINEEDDDPPTPTDPPKPEDTPAPADDSSDDPPEPDDDAPPADDELPKVTVEVDGENKEFFRDAEGNLLDEDKNIVYTKDQLTEEDETDEFTEFFEKTEIPIVDETGAPKEYSKDITGIKEYAKDLYNQGVKDTLSTNNEQVFTDQLFTKYPVIKDVLDHIDKNGSIQGFNSDVDLNVELKPDELTAQRAIVRKDQLDKGATAEDADLYIKFLEDQEKLFDSAKNIQTNMKQAKANEELAAANYAKQQFESYWGMSEDTNKPIPVENSIRDIIYNKKAINVDGKDLSLPDVIRVKNENGSFGTKTRDEFFSFLYDVKPRNIDGQVRYMTDYAFNDAVNRSRRTVQHDVLDALTAFTGINPLVAESKVDDKHAEAKKKIKVVSSGKSKATGGKPHIKLKINRQK